MSRLEKTINRVFVPGSPGQPGSVGQPYLPARDAWTTSQVCSYVPLTPQQLVDAYYGLGVRYQQIDGVWMLYIPAGLSIPTSRYTCRTEQVLEHFPEQPYIPPQPAVPASPAQLLYDYQLGWNARAHSIQPMIHAGRFTFTLPSSNVGAIGGLSALPLSTGLADIRWGFKMSHSVLTIAEAGIDVQSIGTPLNPEVSIERAGGRIIYRVGSTVVRDVAADVASPMYLSGALYSGGDLIDDAELAEFGDGVGEAILEPIQAFGGTEDYAIGIANFERMEAFGGSYSTGGGVAAFEPIEALGADAGGYAVGEEVIEPPMDAEGEATAELAYAIGSADLLPVDAVGSGLTGQVGGADVVLEEFWALGSNYVYSEGRETLEPLDAYGDSYLAADEAVMSSIVVAASNTSTADEFFLIVQANVGVVGLLSVQQLVDRIMASTVTAGSGLLTAAEIELALRSLVSGRFAVDGLNGLSAWALNLDINGSTRYSNFAFNSFAQVNGRYYGANNDGLFVLEGADDDGAPINAKIDFGKLNFGTSARKSMRYCYVGMASNGRLVLKVEADGETYYYDMRDYDELQEMQRFELGRGLRASYYHFTLLNADGCAFNLDTIEFMPIPLTRRL